MAAKRRWTLTAWWTHSAGREIFSPFWLPTTNWNGKRALSFYLSFFFLAFDGVIAAAVFDWYRTRKEEMEWRGFLKEGGRVHQAAGPKGVELDSVGFVPSTKEKNRREKREESDGKREESWRIIASFWMWQEQRAPAPQNRWPPASLPFVICLAYSLGPCRQRRRLADDFIEILMTAAVGRLRSWPWWWWWWLETRSMRRLAFWLNTHSICPAARSARERKRLDHHTTKMQDGWTDNAIH